MNQKKFGSSQWSVRSESLIAKTVPLSTVTLRDSPTSSRWNVQFPTTDDMDENKGLLSSIQRTNKLSKLIRHHRNYLKWKNQMVCNSVMIFFI